MTYLPTLILDAFGIVGIISGGLVVLLSNTSKESNVAATELIANLQKLRDIDREEFTKRLSLLETQHVADIKTLGSLQGQIEVLKGIPLEKLAKTMESIAIDTKTNAVSNAAILNTLQRSALIAETDRDKLLNPSQNIKEQYVEHQLVEQTS